MYASQVMSNSVVDFLKHKNDKIFRADIINDEFLRFIKIVNDFFDCSNGEPVEENYLFKTYGNKDDRFSFLQRVILTTLRVSFGSPVHFSVVLLHLCL